MSGFVRNLRRVLILHDEIIHQLYLNLSASKILRLNYGFYSHKDCSKTYKNARKRNASN